MPDDDIEPYYVKKVTREDPRAQQPGVEFPPMLPCTFECIPASLVTGIFGYIIGAGMTVMPYTFYCSITFSKRLTASHLQVVRRSQ
jgi:hypothetical protein